MYIYIYTYIHTIRTIYPYMGPGLDRALGPGPAAGTRARSRPRAQGPVRARPHVRIDGSYCMYICIYVYMYICIPTFSASRKTHFRDSHFQIPTFSATRKTHFQDSHFQRLLKHIFDFGFFMICGVPEPWEIVGIVGNDQKHVLLSEQNLKYHTIYKCFSSKMVLR